MKEQIIGVLKGADAATKVVEPCRKYGIGAATRYQWKAKCDGLTISYEQRLTAL